MLFDTSATRAAEASLDSLWLKTKVISDNLANVSTPGYKSKHVTFEQVLGKASAARMSESRKASAAQGEQAVSRPALYRTTVMTDAHTDVRIDGNNVSLEREQTELWKSYAQYSYLLDRFSSYYNSINSTINNMRG